MDPDTIELKNLSKSFAYQQIATDIDNCDDRDELKNIAKSFGITSSFTVGFTSAYDGKMKISLGSTDTRATTEGRYVYDILVAAGGTFYTLANGNIYVYNPVSSAP